jgi:hypothetical protein
MQSAIVRLGLGGIMLATSLGAARGADAPMIVSASVSSSDLVTGPLRPSLSVERYLADLVQPIRTYGQDGASLKASDVVLERSKEQAQARASALSQVMRLDLDADGVVTRAEVARGAPRIRARQAFPIAIEGTRYGSRLMPGGAGQSLASGPPRP